MKRLFFLTAMVTIIFSHCHVFAFSFETHKMPILHSNFPLRDIRIRSIDCKDNIIYILYINPQNENLIFSMDFSANILEIITGPALQNHQLIGGFFKTPNGFEIISAKLKNNLITWKIFEFDNLLNLLNETVLPKGIVNLKIRMSINNRERYYCKIIEATSIDTCQIYPIHIEKGNPIYVKAFKLNPSSTRGSFYFFDIYHPYIALTSNDNYEISFYNIEKQSVHTFTNSDFKNTRYSDKELQLLSPGMRLMAAGSPIPPAIDAVHFVNDSVLAVIRHHRPGHKQLFIDFVSVNQKLLKTIAIQFRKEQFKISVASKNMLGIISASNGKLFLRTILLK